MEIGQIIKNARKAKKLSQEQLANQVDYDTGNLSRLERGLQSTTPEKLKRIMDVLGIELAQIGQGFDSPQDSGMSNVQVALQPNRGPKEYPLISWVSAGEWTESYDNHPDDAETWLASVENAGEHGFWLDVRGDSMTCAGNPSFPEGSRILVRPEAELISSKYYVVKLENGESTFKQYIEDAGNKYLRPLNPSYRTIELGGSFKVIGRVVDTKMSGL
ncbi:XRE family transcriptional regulator [Pseudomonas syringae pv. actinidiae]|uniref:helix-turn-helix domain-containing protein n=2 Tax=Pseudomonas syringae TaxID=317 RepID=UPI000358174C|nr:XRE family transcriptional regulator [Pseudomonas syringae]EPM91222.1 XRE family transcriptional regulator [Pseudomonas syringae pv. actinidiae ICMP 19070]MDU8492030.1 XRE family transcriptional regulator [Pseudomonas syringae pv. actinidiae]NVL28992.1 helix-turn-helix domain-containing protein [Pseudomonas syringae pv. actinidiae]NVL29941.1 helix-turn-helix domain-containing protein [Pseudomonas syringae pv. actinidiae]NVL36854.1 helix-turn-helix domain-containing protein [Pseudomonas syri